MTPPLSKIILTSNNSVLVLRPYLLLKSMFVVVSVLPCLLHCCRPLLPAPTVLVQSSTLSLSAAAPFLLPSPAGCHFALIVSRCSHSLLPSVDGCCMLCPLHHPLPVFAIARRVIPSSDWPTSDIAIGIGLEEGIDHPRHLLQPHFQQCHELVLVLSLPHRIGPNEEATMST